MAMSEPLTEESIIRGHRVLFRFVPTEPEDHEQKMIEDVAAEYIIVEEPRANSGLVVYGKYLKRDGWYGNPTLRPVVRHLLQELEAHETKCFHCGAPATKLCDFTIGYAIKGYAHTKKPDSRYPVIDMNKRYTCDRPLCASCATTKGLITFSGLLGGPDSIDYCKDHANAEHEINPQPEAELEALKRRLQMRVVEPEESEPTVDDIEALRKALTRQGISSPVSMEECGVKWLSLVRSLVRSVNRKGATDA